jgi:PAS domain S-box-containing protein
MAKKRSREVSLSLNKGLQTMSHELHVNHSDENGPAKCTEEPQAEVADRTQAEEALRQQGDFVSALLDTVAALVVVLDRQGRITQFNRACENITGYSAAEVLGRVWWEFLVPQDEIPGVMETWEILKAGDFPNAYENHWVAKDGSLRLIAWSNTVLTNGAGEVQHVIGTGIDITERKRTEEELRESDRRLRLAHVAANAGAWEWDLRTNENLWSDELWKVYGLEPHSCEPSYDAWVQTIHPDDLARCEKAVQDAARDGSDLSVEWRVRDADGMERWLMSRGQPVRDAAGAVSRYIGIVLDITERKKAEEDLRRHRDELESRVRERTEELRKAYEKLKEETAERERTEAQLRQAQKMEALGILSGGIAHDFNNILAAVIGFTELLSDREAVGSRDARHLKRIMQAGLRGRDLVKQMLTFSRQTEQEKKPLLVSSVVKETVRLLRASIPSTVSIRVSVKSESSLILGDPVQIQQILMNLCTNAAYAMQEKGGTLDIGLNDFSVSPSNGDPHGIKPGLYMKLTVLDSGAGIAPDIIDKIFDPFFTTKKMGEGTGLGLSVVHGIVKQHDGYITAMSEPGNGSTFTVYLPKISGAPETDAIEDGALPTGSERVLFVDDEAALVEMGEDILAELGYEVTSRMNSKDALALFRLDPSRFDLVMTDQTMPEMTGVELTKELLAVRADMPVILCTGFSHLVDADKAKAAGIRAFAMKPLTKREIAKTIRRVLDE